jgi:hypothetical protein
MPRLLMQRNGNSKDRNKGYTQKDKDMTPNLETIGQIQRDELINMIIN